MSNQKPRVEVTLLSAGEVGGKSKVLQKVGRGCNDLYWVRSQPILNPSRNYIDSLVTSSGELVSWNSVNFSYGVRPVLKADNLDELIKGRKSRVKDGVQIVEYGEFPDLFEETEINNSAFLKNTGKKYSLPPQERFPKIFFLKNYREYDYNGQKVIKVDKEYHPVKPIEFYVDRENSMLISTDVLFNSPIDLSRYFDDNFKKSQLYKYLNSEFIKFLNPVLQTTTSYNENNIPDFMTRSVEQEHIDDEQKSLIERINKLLKRNAELQAISKAMASELKELKDEVKGKKYVRK